MSSAEPATFSTETPGKGSRRTVTLVVLAALVALVIGGGAFAVARMLGGGGDRPAAAMPAGTTAYLQVDIDPSAGQKLAALDVLSKLDPDMMAGARDGDLTKDLVEALIADSEELSALDYERDVEPWLGDRVGVGVVAVAGATEPVPLIAIQTTDPAAAEDAFARIDDDSTGWYVSGDYIVGLPEQHRDAVLADVEAGTLASAESFTADLEELGEQGIVSGWVNLSGLAGMASAMDPEGEMGWGTMPELGSGPELGRLSQGRMAMTARFAEDGLEVVAVTRGTGMDGPTGSDTARLVNQLPADTFAALGLEHGDQWVDLAWTQAQEMIPEEVTALQDEAAASGVELPGDVKTMLGSSLALSVDASIADLVTAAEPPSEIPVAYRVATDPEAAQQLIEELFALGEMDPADAGLVTRTDGDVLTLAGGQAYADRVADPGDTLGADDLYNRVVADAEDADSVFYLDLDAVEDRYLTEIPEEDVRGAVQMLAAVGMSSVTEEDGSSRLTFRVVTE